MCGNGDLPERIDHRGKDHIAERGAEALQHIGQGDPEAGLQNFRTGKDASATGREFLMPPEGSGHQHSAEGDGDGAGYGGTPDSQAGTVKPEREPGQEDGARMIDQKEIQDDIGEIDTDADTQRRAGVTGGTENHAENDLRSTGKHREIENEKVGGGEIPYICRHFHPDGDACAEGEHGSCENSTGKKHNEKCLCRGITRTALFPGAVGFGDV